MRNILVISNDIAKIAVKPSPHTFHPRHADEIQQAAAGKAEVIIASPTEAASHFADAEVIAAFPTRVPEIAIIPNAKWIHSFSAGVDKILTPRVVASAVLVSNSSGIHATPISEHIIGFMLMWTRRSAAALRNQQAHEWGKDESLDELREKNILIVGLGEIGMETARIAHAFGTRIKAVSRSPKNKQDFIERIGLQKDLGAMLPEADFVVITLPHTEETHHLFDAKKFALMKKEAVVINIGRGGIINEQDLVDALKNKTIAGALLDVFETEPLPSDSPLWDMEQVIITPHNSGLSQKYMDRAVTLFCKNLRAYLAGEKLPNEVDKKLGY
ncbi:MAG TPA: D-2-hydroxyacid dehydrogenase [Candidatus Paceibacterota bacterium]|nr:D-2-hydroxyacid dehydrogenase [Candidatus Paceibacterota bacterium]